MNNLKYMIMKVRLCFILFFVFLSFQVKSFADDGVHNGLVYSFDPDGEEAYCMGFYWNNEEGIEVEDIVIPSSVNLEYQEWDWDKEMSVRKRKKFHVVGISLDAFANCNTLKSVSLPSGLKELCENSFGYCENLETVNIGSGLVSIGENVFYSCPKLKDVVLPNTIKVIEQNAFYGCSSLTNIIFPQSLEEIGSMAFYNCKSLCNVTLPRNLRKIGYAAFGACGIKEIIVPKSVQETDEFMGGSIFMMCDSLSDVTVCGPKVFNWSFFYFDNVRNLTIGDDVEEINDFAMLNVKLNRLTLGNGLKTINDQILRYSEINEIYCYANEPPVCKEGNNTFSSATYKNATLIVPEGSIEKYKKAKGWEPFFKRDGRLLVDAHRGFIHYKKAALGVTADGVSQLMIYPEFTDAEFRPISYNLKLLKDGKDVTDNKSLTGEFKLYDKLENGKWGFIYTAPKDFLPDYGNKYTITLVLEFTDAFGKKIKLQRNLYVARVGVLLLHGFASDSSCFRDVKTYLIDNKDYASWQVNNASYEFHSTESFYANTHQHKVIQIFLTQLFYMLAAEGYVSSKYDIVGHSMGGILARKFAQEVNAEVVNSIITVNTPHSGSQIANFIIDDAIPFLENAIEKIPIGNGVARKLFVKTLDVTLKNGLSEFGKLGAGNDLKVNSDAIRMLNSSSSLSNADGIPVHSISSYMTDYQYVKEYSEGEWTTMPVAIAGPIDFITFFPDYDSDVTKNPVFSIYERIFDGDWNDGVVSYGSQRGGLDSRYSTTEAAAFKGWIGAAETSWAYHQRVTHWYNTWYNIGRLLRASKTNSDNFATSFHPIDLSGQANVRKKAARKTSIEIKEPSDSTYVRLHANVDDITNLLNIQLEKSADICRYMIFTYPNDGIIISAHDTTACSFRLPESFNGDLVIYSLGRTTDNAFVGDSIVVNIEQKSTLEYLYFENENTTLLNVGANLDPLVICGWSGGSEEYVSPNFTTDNPNIISIEGQTITALKEGECKLYASYLGQTDSIRVIVIPAMESTGIQELQMNKEASFSYNGSQLMLYFDDSFGQYVTLDIYDFSGICHISKTESVDGTGLTSVDVSTLASGMYIATARTKNGMINYKFIKK